jgi:hypothetical protein
MSVTAAVDSEKKYDAAAVSLLTSLKLGEECLSHDVVNLTQQHFSVEG